MNTLMKIFGFIIGLTIVAVIVGYLYQQQSTVRVSWCQNCEKKWSIPITCIGLKVKSKVYFEKCSQKTKDSSSGSVACTMDAKVCPDGSAVGRIPPKCEFAPCPGQ